MKKLNELTSLRAVEEFLENHELGFLYFSTPECSTCHAILPKLQELLNGYPSIHLAHIDVSHVKEIAERFLILSAPIMILMIEQKEYLRADRFVRFELLKEKLDHIYNMYNLQDN
ncbi:thioredoxin family protein [Solibacillus silvestris]|uniref:thioredoxin family protein n=1 Tax=Solibacillus silvestris TaxID=76853 RepID=UPI003F80F3BB